MVQLRDVIYVALTAAWMDVVVHWLSDLKLGFCRFNFWMDYGTCCNQGNLWHL